MSEGFKILVCIAVIMAGVGDFCIIEERNIFPLWMYLVMTFYMVVVWIDERLVPLVKDVADLFKNGT
jgi:hypothetical protein